MYILKLIHISAAYCRIDANTQFVYLLVHHANNLIGIVINININVANDLMLLFINININYIICRKTARHDLIGIHEARVSHDTTHIASLL